MKHKFNLNKKGFSLVEIVVVIAIVVVLLAVLAPTVLTYTEKSRIQKDESAMDEICNVAQLALADSETFDEVFSYSISNNYVTYSDSSGEYGKMVEDEEYWAPDGSGHAVTITWNPDENGNYTLGEGLVNDMTFGNGSVGQSRTVDEVKQCYLKEMGSQKFHTAVQQSIGAKFAEKSATYKNSSYTMFIRFNLVDGIYRADVYGQFNGTNLLPDSEAAIGSGTETYTPEGEAVVTKPQGGTQQAQYSSSDLQGSGGGGAAPTYKEDYMECGHRLGTPGNHEKLVCGHYECACPCNPAPCGQPDHTTGDGLDHSLRACGHYACLCSGVKIPDGGTYYIGVTSEQYLWSYAEKRTGGDCFPAECKNGDAYTYDEYQYRFNQYAGSPGNSSYPYWHYNYNFDGWGCNVSSRTKTSYKSPLAEINGKPLVSVGGAWAKCTKITKSPAIPDSVHHFYETYRGCTSLTTAPTLPPNTKTLHGVFWDCPSLKTYEGSIDAAGDFSNYKIPTSTQDMLNAFLFCKSITHGPKIPQNVQTIWQAFHGCTAMVVAPDMTEANSLTDMEYSFWDCPALIEAPVIPPSVTAMREAFSGCTNMRTAPVLPEGVINMYRVFLNCSSLTTAPRIPENATYLCEMFKGCTSLTGTVTIDSGPKRAHDSSHSAVFSGVDFQSQNLTLTGASGDIDTIGKSGQNYCHICNGKHKHLHIETDHYHAHNQDYVVLGTWDFRDAKSVNIIVEYHLQGTSWDWISITEGTDYIPGQSYNDTRRYLNTSGNIVSTTGTNNNVKFQYNSYTMTKSFNNVNMLTGSVIFRSDSSINKWGARVTVIPNY